MGSEGIMKRIKIEVETARDVLGDYSIHRKSLIVPPGISPDTIKPGSTIKAGGKRWFVHEVGEAEPVDQIRIGDELLEGVPRQPA